MNDARPDTVIRKLLKKPPAIVAISIIIITCLIAVFAYQLSPDNTPDANRMVVELAAKPPGFTMHFLNIPKKNAGSIHNNASEWFSGKQSDHDLLPYNGYTITNDNLIVRHYIDDSMEDTIRISYNMLLPLNLRNAALSTMRNYIQRTLLETRTFYLGTDRYGRDILSRLLAGTRVSLSVGLIAVLLSISIGIILGSVAGYYGGIIDNAIMWLINILWAIPTLLLVFAITLTIGKGFWEIFIAIGLTMWVGAARLIRGQVMVLRKMEYITAAKALGLPDYRIIFKHILPNIAGPIMVIAASNFATAILIEAGLSFLGIGVQPPQPSWGLMIKEHYNFLITNRPLLAIIPGLAIMLLVYAFNILGNALRDVLDVKS
ncbi:MAG: ABC transporter permease [Taibaiella sp.]|nr:ABC transporter permease [Taibaiella sp.]